MAPPPKPGSGAGMQELEQSPVYNGSANVAAASPAAALVCVLRFAAVVLTLAAAIVMGAAKQTELFANVNGDLVIITMKAIGGSAFQFFVAANSIACAYGLVSLALSIASRGGSRNQALVLTIVDLVMVCLLFAGNGAASAFGVLARNGDGDLWIKFCNFYGKFCDHITASIVLSMLAALAYLLLVIFSILGTHTRSQ